MNQNLPLVSVIVPNYNHANYLEQRLNTVFNQTYQNFEVIILDDKSTDNSLEVIDRYKNNPHVSQILVNEGNAGSPFKQWDKGINLAKGKFIWIAESDDYNELTFLEELITEWQKHKNVVVAFSNYVPFWDDEYIRYKERKSQCFNGRKYAKCRMARYCCICNASGAVFKKDAYKFVDKEFMSFRSAGDYMFWTSLLQFGDVLKINKNLTYWRKSAISVTGTNEGKGITAMEDKKVLDYIEKTYQLNWWQKRMAYGLKLEYFSNFSYDSIGIRQDIFSIWEESKYRWRPSVLCKWIVGALERHMNILI